MESYFKALQDDLGDVPLVVRLVVPTNDSQRKQVKKVRGCAGTKRGFLFKASYVPGSINSHYFHINKGRSSTQ